MSDDKHPITKLVGRRVQRIRKSRSMNQQALLDVLKDRYGVHMSRPVLGDVEHGRRDLTVTELAAFALALEVPPATLVTPPGSTQIEFTPRNGTMTPDAAYHWWIGITSITFDPEVEPPLPSPDEIPGGDPLSEFGAGYFGFERLWPEEPDGAS